MKDRRNQELRDELRELSPFLARLKEEGNEEGFGAPPGYFRELPDRVVARLQEEGAGAASSGWVAGLLRLLPRPRLAAALAGVAVVAAVLFFARKPEFAAEPLAPPVVSAEDIHDYIRDNLVDFDEELVVEAAGATQALDELPEPHFEGGEQLLDEYYEELIRDIDQESIEEIL